MSHKLLAVVALALLGTVAVYHIKHSHGEHHGSANTTLLATDNKTINHYYPNYVMMFHSYKIANNLRFGAAEDSKRLQIFITNAKLVQAHNAKNNSSYKLGITDLAHLTLEEFAALKLGYKGAKKASPIRGEHIVSDDGQHKTVDWVKEGAVTAVKNQGQCGSCWSFSTTGSLEGLNFIKNHKLISFSEQDLVDCSTSYGNQGCNGGLMDQAFEYVQAKGIATEADYPYTAADGTCNENVKRAFKITGHKDVPADNVKALVEAITHQPVSVAIEADTSAFQLYASGVLTGDACGTQLDHGVLAVGYGVQGGKAYIKVKNSWGPSWGLEGYVLIGQASGAGVCGINSDPSYPTL